MARHLQKGRLDRLLAAHGVSKEEFSTWLEGQVEQFLQTRPRQDEIQIPLKLISQEQVGNVGAISWFLHSRGSSVLEISKALLRDARSITASIRKVDERTNGVGVAWSPEDPTIPLRAFATALSPLEVAVRYLRKERGLHPWQIAALLKRDQRLIATIWQRVKRKEVQHG